MTVIFMTVVISKKEHYNSFLRIFLATEYKLLLDKSSQIMFEDIAHHLY